MSKFNNHVSRLDAVIAANQHHIHYSIEDLDSTDVVDSNDGEVREGALFEDYEIEPDNHYDEDNENVNELSAIVEDEDDASDIDEVEVVVEENEQAVEALFNLATETRLNWVLYGNVANAVRATGVGVESIYSAAEARDADLDFALEGIGETIAKHLSDGKKAVAAFFEKIMNWIRDRLDQDIKARKKIDAEIGRYDKTIKELSKVSSNKTTREELSRSVIMKVPFNASKNSPIKPPAKGTFSQYATYFAVDGAKINGSHGIFVIMLHQDAPYKELVAALNAKLAKAKFEALMKDVEDVIKKAIESNGEAIAIPESFKPFTEDSQSIKGDLNKLKSVGGSKEGHALHGEGWDAVNKYIDAVVTDYKEAGDKIVQARQIDAVTKRVSKALKILEKRTTGDNAAATGVATTAIKNLSSELRLLAEFYFMLRQAALLGASGKIHYVQYLGYQYTASQSNEITDSVKSSINSATDKASEYANSAKAKVKGLNPFGKKDSKEEEGGDTATA